MIVSYFIREIGVAEAVHRAVTFDPRLERGYSYPVRWNDRLKSSAGRASLHGGIELHPGLKREGIEAIRSTFLHELAHIHADILYGEAGQAHGREWWEAMVRLGEKPWITRRHNYRACRQSVRSDPAYMLQLLAQDVAQTS